MSIQWLSRNRKHMDEEPDLIVIDEAHHALAETYRILWEKYPEARKLGMTATPCRLNGKGFTDLFDSLITSWTVAEFIGKGVDRLAEETGCGRGLPGKGDERGTEPGDKYRPAV